MNEIEKNYDCNWWTNKKNNKIMALKWQIC